MELMPPDKVFAFGASPSMLALWQLCKHKWWLHYIARQGRTEREAQKDSGAAFHKFFADWYGPVTRTLEEHIENFKKEFPEQESTDKRDQKHCLAILKAYTERYPRENEPFKVIETEQKLNVEIPGCKLKLNGVIDLSVDLRNGLWVIDHKTSNRLGTSYFDQFRNHWQTYTYIYAAGVHYKRKCEGILYNAVGMKQKIDADSFLRCDVSKTQDQLDFHIAQWTEHVNEMYDFVTANWQDGSKFFSANTPSACHAYNVKCFALDYCEFNQNERMLP
jgi:hypothetical protein